MARAIRNAIRANRFARIDSRESFALETPIVIVHQADSHESLEFPIRANHPICANRVNRFARITPLSSRNLLHVRSDLVRSCGAMWVSNLSMPSRRYEHGAGAVIGSERSAKKLRSTRRLELQCNAEG